MWGGGAYIVGCNPKLYFYPPQIRAKNILLLIARSGGGRSGGRGGGGRGEEGGRGGIRVPSIHIGKLFGHSIEI